LIPKAEGQLGCESTVQLQGNEPLATTCEDFGNRAVTWADLDYGALANVAEGVHNGMASSIIHKKVLPKFWFKFHLHPIVFALL